MVMGAYRRLGLKIGSGENQRVDFGVNLWYFFTLMETATSYNNNEPCYHLYFFECFQNCGYD